MPHPTAVLTAAAVVVRAVFSQEAPVNSKAKGGSKGPVKNAKAADSETWNDEFMFRHDGVDAVASWSWSLDAARGLVDPQNTATVRAEELCFLMTVVGLNSCVTTCPRRVFGDHCRVYVGFPHGGCTLGLDAEDPVVGPLSMLCPRRCRRRRWTRKSNTDATPSKLRCASKHGR